MDTVIADTILVSDLHLGSETSRAREATLFLRTAMFNRLILLGDIFCDLNFRRLKKEHWQFLSLIRKLSNPKRGLVKVLKGAEGARNYSQCDSMLLGDRCGAHTFPYIDVGNTSSTVEHEASVSKIGEDQIFYCQQRGVSAEDAVSMIVNGFCKEVFRELPMEFAVEAQKLLGVSLEGSVG